ncbi:MAG: AAA family ATPase [Deltaproteobacteria bacterium]|nr:AAA family ATPase [Deltaproteobacteria bacterium]
MIPESELAPRHAAAERLLAGLDAVLYGQEALTRQVVTALLAGGHVLLEGLPGLGKTELVKALAHLVGLPWKRVQFTPDLLPSDITGNHILEERPGGGRALTFRPGPLFAHIVLADEINRASPKTQSALLEAMQERSVTVLDTTHALPDPFFVLATQNPVELEGTYPLPEAQLDRFHVKLEVLGVGPDVLTRILTTRPEGRPDAPAAVLADGELRDLVALVRRVALPPAVADYIARVVHATRPEVAGARAEVKDNLRFGASPRAAIALAGCARAAAFLAGRPAVGFADVRALAPAVIAHRLIRSYEASLRGLTARDIVGSLLDAVPELPA